MEDYGRGMERGGKMGECKFFGGEWGGVCVGFVGCGWGRALCVWSWRISLKKKRFLAFSLLFWAGKFSEAVGFVDDDSYEVA